MTDKEELYQGYYQPDHLWTSAKRIKELHKRDQIMVSETTTLAGPYTTSKGNKSSSLRCDRT